MVVYHIYIFYIKRGLEGSRVLEGEGRRVLGGRGEREAEGG